MFITGAVVFVVGGLVLAEVGFRAAGCDIKGNISVTTGEGIYHVPGQEDHSRTRINFLKGESGRGVFQDRDSPVCICS